ncbi:MAG: hypothetical protein JRD89_00180 [Deltaproteobacteria bacterium]|nr:hypothetical protein [Deltaproteobacteria bacterium]
MKTKLRLKADNRKLTKQIVRGKPLDRPVVVKCHHVTIERNNAESLAKNLEGVHYRRPSRNRENYPIMECLQKLGQGRIVGFGTKRKHRKRKTRYELLSQNNPHSAYSKIKAYMQQYPGLLKDDPKQWAEQLKGMGYCGKTYLRVMAQMVKDRILIWTYDNYTEGWRVATKDDPDWVPRFPLYPWAFVFAWLAAGRSILDLKLDWMTYGYSPAEIDEGLRFLRKHGLVQVDEKGHLQPNVEPTGYRRAVEYEDTGDPIFEVCKTGLWEQRKKLPRMPKVQQYLYVIALAYAVAFPERLIEYCKSLAWTRLRNLKLDLSPCAYGDLQLVRRVGRNERRKGKHNRYPNATLQNLLALIKRYKLTIVEPELLAEALGITARHAHRLLWRAHELGLLTIVNIYRRPGSRAYLYRVSFNFAAPDKNCRVKCDFGTSNSPSYSPYKLFSTPSTSTIDSKASKGGHGPGQQAVGLPGLLFGEKYIAYKRGKGKKLWGRVLGVLGVEGLGRGLALFAKHLEIEKLKAWGWRRGHPYEVLVGRFERFEEGWKQALVKFFTGREEGGGVEGFVGLVLAWLNGEWRVVCGLLEEYVDWLYKRATQLGHDGRRKLAWWTMQDYRKARDLLEEARQRPIDYILRFWYGYCTGFRWVDDAIERWALRFTGQAMRLYLLRGAKTFYISDEGHVMALDGRKEASGNGIHMHTDYGTLDPKPRRKTKPTIREQEAIPNQGIDLTAALKEASEAEEEASVDEEVKGQDEVVIVQRPGESWSLPLGPNRPKHIRVKTEDGQTIICYELDEEVDVYRIASYPGTGGLDEGMYVPQCAEEFWRLPPDAPIAILESRLPTHLRYLARYRQIKQKFREAKQIEDLLTRSMPRNTTYGLGLIGIVTDWYLWYIKKQRVRHWTPEWYLAYGEVLLKACHYYAAPGEPAGLKIGAAETWQKALQGQAVSPVELADAYDRLTMVTPIESSVARHMNQPWRGMWDWFWNWVLKGMPEDEKYKALHNVIVACQRGHEKYDVETYCDDLTGLAVIEAFDDFDADAIREALRRYGDPRS